MLRTYSFIPHKFMRIQSFMDDVFDMWCHAGAGNRVFRPKSFPLGSNTRTILEHMHKYRNGVLSLCKKIHSLFCTLTDAQRDDLKAFYAANNDVQTAVADPTARVATYADIEALHPVLSNHMKKLYELLWLHGQSYSCFNKPDLLGHYADFINTHSHVCRACGLHKLTYTRLNHRAAYDHYLAKSLYPFTAVNLRNLVPSCHECNTVCKGEKDILHKADSTRRKAVYPYAYLSAPTVRIEVGIGPVRHITSQAIAPELSIALNGSHPEEVETWQEVYNIRTRYLDELRESCMEWMLEYEEFKDAGGDAIQKMEDLFQRAPLHEKRFLKLAFFKAFHALCEKQAHSGSNVNTVSVP